MSVQCWNQTPTVPFHPACNSWHKHRQVQQEQRNPQRAIRKGRSTERTKDFNSILLRFSIHGRNVALFQVILSPLNSTWNPKIANPMESVVPG